MSAISIQYFETPFGVLVLGTFNEALCLCDWQHRKRRTAIDERLSKWLKANFVEKKHALLNETIQQLGEYFNGQRKVFDLPLLMVGTDFQKVVWNRLLKIPYGKTWSYLALAKAIGDGNAVRAVANANAANALSIIIPCHRIIGSTGQPVGYSGGVETKKQLLKIEQ